MVINDAKERVRQAIDIVDLVNGYISLSRQGKGYVGLCPFHDDSKPSLTVNQDRQTWRCWVCDLGGDIFNFVMKREGMEFREALEMLAEKAGIELGTGPRVGNPNTDRKALFAAMKWAVEKYHQALLESPLAESARKYLVEREISDASIDTFKIGFAPNDYNWLWNRAEADGIALASLMGAGLIGKNEGYARPFDRFRGRVLFPITDPQKRFIALGGRILAEFATEKTGKYYNSSDTPLFHKSRVLYNLDNAREHAEKAGEILVMEGYTDVVMCHQYGIQNAVAVLGVAITKDHIRQLRRYDKIKRIVLVLDGDDAGQKRANETLSLFLEEQVDLRVLTLPDRQDPCDFVQSHGAEAFKAATSKSRDALEFALEYARNGRDLRSDTHAASQVVSRILDMIALAPRLSSGSSSDKMLREQQMLGRLARETGVPENTLRQMLSEKRSVSERQSGSKFAPQVVNQPPVKKLSVASMPAIERELIEIFTQHPDLAPLALEQLALEDFAEGVGRMLLNAYNDVFCEGYETDLAHVLSAIEDEQLKGVLVRLDDEASQKEEHASIPAQVRLENILANFRDWRESQGLQQRVGALRGQANEDAEKELLEELIAQAKRRQQLRS